MPTPFGSISVHVVGARLERIELAPALMDPNSSARTPLLRRVLAQLQRYFDDPRAAFNLPLADAPTAFQDRVRGALAAIPPGESRSYADLAAALGSSPRAVGGACRRNPVPIVIPCHRVVARVGRGGFMGETGGRALEIKDWLLRHEQDRCAHAGRLL